MTVAADRVLEAGLSSEEARRRLALYGPNLPVARARRRTAFGWALRGLADPMVLLLLAAAAVYVAIGSVGDALTAGLAIIPIAAVGVLLEMRSERALERLRALVAPVARVRRDGRLREIPGAEVVPGDVLAVEEGDIVPADCEVLGAANLQLDESALTGESEPVAKAERSRLLAGSTVLAGRGTALVEATGRTTEYGRIGSLVAGIRQPPTPLERLIRRLMLRLAAVAVLFCVAVAAVELARGRGWGAALIAGVSLAIAAVPEEFPMVFTLYLGLGAWRLAREHALIRRLSAVETLGAASVICVDKTGTLTLGRLEVAEVRAAPGTSEAALLEAAVLACEPRPFDPLERAILDFAAARGVAAGPLHAHQLVRDHPFDHHRRYMSHLWRVDGGLRVAAKGSLEGILEVAGAAPAVHGWASAANSELARAGRRVVAIATGTPAAGADGRAADEASLRLVGLAAFSDPVRPGVVESVRECRQAGIRVVMLTGDHALTATAVAEAIGLDGTGGVVTGAELDAMDDAALAAAAATASVFARIRPEQKHRLVRAYRSLGEVVAMTGDGINDAPALREAEIGVAMGRRGTEVAREAASLVLLDDDFTTIVAAVRDGRRIFGNLQRAFAYLVSFHVPLLLGAFLVPLLGLPLLLLPVHLVLLELLMHPAVSLVFEAQPAPPGTMRRPPRSARSQLLPVADFRRALLAGAVLAGAVLAVYWWRVSAGDAERLARAAAFAALLLGQLVLLAGERSRPHPLFRPDLWLDRTSALVLLPSLALVAAVTYLGPLAGALQLAPLSAAGWGVALAVAALTAAWVEAAKLVELRRR